MSKAYEALLTKLSEREQKAQLDYNYYKGAREGVQLLYKELLDESIKPGTLQEEETDRQVKKAGIGQ